MYKIGIKEKIDNKKKEILGYKKSVEFEKFYCVKVLIFQKNDKINVEVVTMKTCV